MNEGRAMCELVFGPDWWRTYAQASARVPGWRYLKRQTPARPEDAVRRRLTFRRS